MTEKATAIFVPIAIPPIYRKGLPLKWNKFTFSISFIRSSRVDAGIAGLG